MKETGTVYFFTGLSGAGKTTLGSLFYQRLKAARPNTVYLDGDEIRVAFGEDVGYTNDERLRWAGRIFRVCKLLAEQNIDVVVCSIAMFSQQRLWNREKIANYKEIYVKVSRETLIRRNQKGLYTTGKNVVGVDLPFDEPSHADLVVENDGQRTPLEVVESVERALLPAVIENPVDNRNYWDHYYQNGRCPGTPSPFAQYVATLVDEGKNLLELGCGNGRDAIFFAEQGLSVTALDISQAAIQQLHDRKISGVDFHCCDFVENLHYKPEKYWYAYSRFTIHAINQSQERVLLEHIYETLKKNGKFFIEVRSIHDSLFGKGRALERNAYFYDNHYRRFIVLEELKETLETIGFRVDYARESKGFAPYGDDDPIVIRMVATKT